MKLSDGASNALVLVAVACALVTTGLRVWQEVRGPDVDVVVAPPRVVENAERYAVGGARLGRADARLTIVEFSDFECPFCAKAALGPLHELRTEFPQDLAIVYRHAPLPQHRFAIPAARASACADEQGRFEALHDLLFLKQDSIGLKSWSSFAVDAGVPDLASFDRCQQRPGSWQGLARDSTAVEELGIRGTPSFVVDGLLYVGAPPVEKIRALLRTTIR